MVECNGGVQSFELRLRDGVVSLTGHCVMHFNAAMQGMHWIVIAKWSVFTWDHLQLQDELVCVDGATLDVFQCS